MPKERLTTTFFERHPEMRLEPEVIDQLVAVAQEARENAYTPYSHYNVGAAVLCQSGEIYGGCNVENVAYTPTIHAEQVAIVKAVNAGEAKHGRRFIKALVVVHKENTPPCGLCCQTIIEFCDDTLIINTNLQGDVLEIDCFSELLRRSFSPSDLGID